MSVLLAQGGKFFLITKFLFLIQILILDIIQYNIYRFVTVWVILEVPYFLCIDSFMISIGLLDLFQVFSLLYFLLFLHLHYHLLHLTSSPLINLFLSLSILLFRLQLFFLFSKFFLHVYTFLFIFNLLSLESLSILFNFSLLQ